MNINVKTSQGEYNVTVERGVINKLDNFLDLKRRVLIVTDTGVPAEYSKTVANQCESPVIFTFEQGEASKCLNTYKEILEQLVKNNFTRSDCIIAVGGGVVGDISGFAASSFMRGIDFYNIPTTLLSQIDSSIGGKTAIDFMGIKNIVGAFYPPKAVIIDPNTLKTLPQRQISNGMAEALKMATTSDPKLFNIFLNNNLFDKEVMDEIIYRSLLIKKDVVEKDEHECGLRRVLNFGHTLAHAVESVNKMDNFYHGECVAIGMVPMCSEQVRNQLIEILKKLNLPYKIEDDADLIAEACRHDKKMSGDTITVVYVSQIGNFEFKSFSFNEFKNIIEAVIKNEK